MKYKVSVRYHVKVEAKDERNAVEEGHTALCKEFSLTEYQLAFCIYKVEKVGEVRK